MIDFHTLARILKYTTTAVLASLVYSCTTLSRGFVHWSPEADDYKIFTQDTINRSSAPFRFVEKQGVYNLDTARLRNRVTGARFSYNQYIDSTLLSSKGGGIFLVIENDTIRYERQKGDFDRYTGVMLFSVSKSITSLLCGIALDRGLIEGIDDPVTKYLPELNEADPMFKRLTVSHLLNMTSGIKHPENYINPFKGTARLYYGTNQMQQVKHLKFDCEPGVEYNYQSITTTVLGLVLESVIDMPLAKFAEENVWQPLGMERDGLLALDDPRNRSAKTFAGFFSNATDLAKIGRLYLNGGEWNGRQIVSQDWVEKSLSSDASHHGYSQCWYMQENTLFAKSGSYRFPDSLSMAKRFDELEIPKEQQRSWKERDKEGEYWYGRYYTEGENNAYGINDQILYINRKKGIIMVRLGIRWADGNPDFIMSQTANKFMP